MNNTYELPAETRAEVRRGASRRLRHAGYIPAIVYGGEGQPVMIKLPHQQMWAALENEAFYSHILTLKIDGHPQQVVLKDIQRHPYRKQIVHMDFLRVSATEKLHMNVPLHFMGESESSAIKLGGILVTHLREVEIECLPADLPEFISVDISGLQLNHTIYLSDIKLPPNVALAADLAQPDENLPVVSIQVFKEEKPEVVAEAAAAPEGEEEAKEKEGEEEKASVSE